MWEKLVSNISVKSRIKIFFTLLALFFVGINIFTLYTINQIKKDVSDINNKFGRFQSIFNKINNDVSELVLNTYVYAEEKVSYTDFYNFYIRKQQSISHSISVLEKEIKSFESYLLFQKLNSALALLDNYSLEILQAYKNQDFVEVKKLYVQQYELYKSVKANIEKLKTVTNSEISRSAVKVREEIRTIIAGLVFFDIVIILAIVIFFLLFFKEFGGYYRQITEVLKDAGKGYLTATKLPESDSELGRLARSINKFFEARKRMAVFIQKLISEEYDEAVLEELSDGDIIAQSLNQLADRLREAKRQQKAREEEEKQKRWHTEGMNLFSDIMRSSSDDLQKLGDSVIKNLVKYLDASVGGLFILNDDDSNDVHLSLLSVFAYDRKKYYTKRLELGEGLVGTAAVDKTVIYLTDVPEDYMEIESGLGDSVPNTLLIVPLLTDRGVMGVVEIASFRKFEKHELDFVEDVAKSIAATLEAVKVNARTLKLLEETRQKSEELARNEAQLRKTMEQVRIAQERAEEHAAEMTSILNAVSQALLKVEFDAQGKITAVNDSFLRTLQLTERQVMGEHFRNILPKDNRDLDKVIIKKLESYQIYKDTLHYKLGERDVWLLVQFAPILGKNNELNRVLWLSIDVTEQKEIELKNAKLLEESIKKSEELMQAHQVVKRNEIELKSIMQGIDQALLRAEYSVEGILLFANEKHRKTLGYNYEEVLGKSIFIFIPEQEKEEFQKLWQEVASGALKQIQVKRKTAQGEDIWLLNQYTPVRDDQGNIVKILYLAIDVTEQVEAEQRARKLLEESQKIQHELQQKEAELSAIMEGIDQAILRAEYDIDGTFLYANELHRKTFGYDYEEVLGKNILMFVSEEEKEDFEKMWSEVVAGKMMQLRVKRKAADGRDIWLLNQYAPVKDEDGNVYKVVYLAQDITEQVKAEHEAKEALEKAKRHEKQLLNFQEVLRKAEAERRAVLAGIDRAILRAEYSADGILLFANELHRQTFGYEYENVLGKSIFTFIPEDEREEFEKHWKDIVKGQTKQLRVRRYDANGKEIWLLNQYSPVKDEEGNVYKILYLAQDITEQVKAEHEAKKALAEAIRREKDVRDAQKRMESLLRAIDTMLLRVNYTPEGLLEEASEEAFKFFGVSKEMIGKFKIYNFIEKRRRKEFFRVWEEKILKGEIYQAEWSFVKDGKTYWFQTSFAPIIGVDGKVVEIVTLNLDITETKKKETELNRLLDESMVRELELKVFLQAVDATLLRAEYLPDGTLIAANKLHQEILGYELDKVKGRKIFEFIPKDELDEFKKVWEKVVAGEPRQMIVKRYREDTNEEIWFLNQYTPVVDENGKVSRIIYLAINITDQKQLEKKLSGALKNIEYLLKGVDTVLLRATYDKEGRLLTANKLHQDTLGYEFDDLKGKKIIEFIPEDEREEFLNVWEKALSGQAQTLVVRRVRKDTGEPLWLLNQYIPIKNESGEIERVLYLATDISEQKELELRLQYFTRGVDEVMLRAEYLPDGTLVDANKLHQQVLGYNLDEFKGKNIVEFVPHDERESFISEIWTKVREGRLLKVVVRRKRTDINKEIWLLNQYIPIKTADGQLERIVYLAVDITEQKELEAELEALTKAIDKSYMRVDLTADGIIERTNELHSKIIGYKPGGLNGKNIFNVSPEDEREQLYEIWQELKKGKNQQQIVRRVRKDNNKRVWLLNSFVPLFDKSGKFYKVIILAIDFTREYELLQKGERHESVINSLNLHFIKASFYLDKTVINRNELFDKFFGTEDNLENMLSESEKKELDDLWSQLLDKKSVKFIVERNNMLLVGQLAPVLDKEGSIEKILYLAIDIKPDNGFKYGGGVSSGGGENIEFGSEIDKEISKWLDDLAG